MQCNGPSSPYQQLKLEKKKEKNKCHFQARAAHLILRLSSPSSPNSLSSCPKPQSSTGSTFSTATPQPPPSQVMLSSSPTRRSNRELAGQRLEEDEVRPEEDKLTGQRKMCLIHFCAEALSVQAAKSGPTFAHRPPNPAFRAACAPPPPPVRPLPPPAHSLHPPRRMCPLRGRLRP
jgi:hypothetical protein